MQIPLIQPIEVNGRPPAPHASVEAYGAASEALARGGEHVGVAITAAAEKYAQAGAREAAALKRQQMLDSHAEAANLQSQIELALQQSEYDLKRTETDPAAYLESRRQSYKTVADQITQQAKQPYTQQILAQHLPGVFATLDKSALAHADSLRVKNATAELTTTLDNVDQAIALTPYTDTAAIGHLNALKDVAINARAPMLGVDVAEKMKIAERKKTTEEVAWRHADADPQGFVNGGWERYRGMDAEKLDKMKTGAVLHIDTLERRQKADEDKAQAKLDREIAQQRTRGYSDLTDQVLAGGVTETAARAHPAWDFLEAGQKEHVINMIRDPKTAPSDPATRSMVLNRALVSQPTMTAAELTRLHTTKGPSGQPLLNDTDFTLAMNHVRERGDYWRGQAKSDAHRAEDQQRHTWEREQGYVDHTMDTALSLTGSIAERLDPKQQELKAIARETMFRESRTFRGKRDPNDIMHEILPDLMVRLADGPDGVKDDVGKLQRIIELSPYKTKQDLLKAKGKIDEGKFYEYAERFKQLDEAQRTYDALQETIKRRREEAARKAKK